MGPAATTACGILVGLIVFLAMAMLGVIAVNGTDNPGFTRQASAAAGGTAPKPAAQTKGALGSLDLDGDGKLTQAEFDRLAKLPPATAPKPKGKKPSKPSRAEATAAAGG